jgi:PiT family inorganic phosphate transporter
MEMIHLAELKKKKASIALSKAERKSLKKEFRQELVKRSAIFKIAAAWVITVPAAGIMAALLFLVIKGLIVSDSAEATATTPRIEAVK